MDRETLLALAERCERATEGSRELSGEIWCALRGHTFIELSPPNYIVIWQANAPHERWARCHIAMPPDYTHSLDAALALVPEGLRWSMDSEASAAVYFQTDPPTCGDCLLAATPALAMCAAALRARAQETPTP